MRAPGGGPGAPSLLLFLAICSTLFTGQFMFHQVLQQRQLASALSASRVAEAASREACGWGEGLGVEKPAEVLRLESQLREKAAEVERLERAVRTERQRASTQTGGSVALRGNASDTDRLLAVVAVSSHPARTAMRSALRASWFPPGSAARAVTEAETGLAVRFFVGLPTKETAKQLRAESEAFGDIVQLEHVELAGDLSEKTLRLLAAALSQFEPRFVVKADDDTWVDLGELAAVLRAREGVENAYLGCMRQGSPLSFAGDALSAHLAVGQSLVFSDPEPSVLPYAAGQLYALGADVAAQLVGSAHALRRMGNEDVSLGAWMVGLRHEPLDEPRFCCAEGCAVAAEGGGGRVRCVAVVQPQCAGVCEPEQTLPLLSQHCGADATEDSWATAEEVLEAAAGRRKRGTDGG